MTTNITKALAHLNAATGRTYTITESGAQFTLSMPLGGFYAACDATAMMQRLVTMRIAATGRIR